MRIRFIDLEKKNKKRRPYASGVLRLLSLLWAGVPKHHHPTPYASGILRPPGLLRAGVLEYRNPTPLRQWRITPT